MPCRTDYDNSYYRAQQHNRECAEMAVWLGFQLGLNVNKAIQSAVVSGKNVGQTEAMCETLTSLDKDVYYPIIYNGRDPMARKVADWWDRHQEFDRKRLVQEKEDARKNRVGALADVIGTLSDESLNKVAKFLKEFPDNA